MEEEKNFSAPLTRERKIGFVLLLVFAIIAVGLGMFQIRNTIYAPFALSNSIPSTLKEQLIDNNVAYQKQLDTDRDGLSNFDEVNVYGTSAYLYDTFGYGMSDLEVIKKGLPLCPAAGKNCVGIVNPTDILQPTASSSGFVSTAEAEALKNPPPDLNAILQDPAQIRRLLINSGQIGEDDLKKISDVDLLQVVREMIATTTLKTTVPTSSP
jgi:hypothetical protein